MRKHNFLGIDFSTGQVNIFALTRHWGRITAKGHWQLDPAEIQSSLASLCQELTDKEPPTAVVGLSRRQLIYRELTLPPLQKSALEDAIGYQLVEKSPYEPNQIKFAYKLQEIPEGWQVEAIAVPIGELERIKMLLDQAGFSKITFAPSSQAMGLLAKRGELVGRVGQDLQLGLGDSLWGRDLPLTGEDQLSGELAKTLSYLEGTGSQKLTVKLAGHKTDWQPTLAGESLGPHQIVAAGLALAGARGQTLELKRVGQKQDYWFKNPYLVAGICLWLGLGISASLLSRALRVAQEELTGREAQRREVKVELPWKRTQSELEQILPQNPPEDQLEVLRQLALAPGAKEGYLTLTISQGEVKELVALGPQATEFLRRLKSGPLSALTLEGPITTEEGKERFTLTGPVEVRDED